MHKLTVLTLLSLSLTAACMSEASWSHRDRAGFPVSTWTYRSWQRDHACRELRRAAVVAPDSLSPRMRGEAAWCGLPLDVHPLETTAAAAPRPAPAARPSHASVPAETLPQSVAGR